MDISREQSSALKAIAIISVIFAHAYGWGNIFNNIPVLNSYRVLSTFVQCGLTLFYILSGYGIYKSFCAKGLYHYWNDKMIKVYLPAFLIQAVWCIVLFCVSKNSIIERDNALIFADLLCVSEKNSIDGTMWFLSFLFFCYLTFYLFFALISNEEMALLLFTMCWLITTPIMGQIWESAIYYTPFFAIGVVVSFLSQKEVLKIKLGYAGTIALGILSILYIAFLFRKNFIVDIIFCAVGAFFLISFVKCLNEVGIRLLNWIGEISFYIYLLEYKIIFCLVVYENYSDVVRLIIFLLLLILTIILASVLDKLVRYILRYESDYKIKI